MTDELDTRVRSLNAERYRTLPPRELPPIRRMDITEVDAVVAEANQYVNKKTCLRWHGIACGCWQRWSASVEETFDAEIVEDGE